MKTEKNRVVLNARSLDGALTARDMEKLAGMQGLYDQALEEFRQLQSAGGAEGTSGPLQSRLIGLYDVMGKTMQEIVAQESGRINVYPFVQPHESRGEASRLIAKLRDIRTPHEEFVYYIQRAYELLFNFAFCGSGSAHKNHLVVRTPVTFPVENYAVHKLPFIDDAVKDCVMCVLLRGALLPSMIMAKEMQEYSTGAFSAPFALFRIKRNDEKNQDDMEYIMDLRSSYFDPSQLHGKDLVFADPMNATGGSLVTIIDYLDSIGVKPRSVLCFNVISALKGALQIIRSIPEARIYTLWMDPVLNEKAYIMPGLGDAGDRLNGRDSGDQPRNLIQLIADYGSNISNLYRSQVREIENTVLSRPMQFD